VTRPASPKLPRARGAARSATREAARHPAAGDLQPDTTALFLDIDGTLLEIAATPASVRVEPGTVELLGRLQARLGGALALISGRPIDDVDRLFAPLRLPTAGQHGTERRDGAGRFHRHDAPLIALDRLRSRIAAFAAGTPGVLVEDKGLSIAVHYRLAPLQASRVRDFLEQALRASDDDLGLQAGKMVLEIKPTGRNKGTAIAEFLAEPPFLGRVPAFLGDDVTDEFGFEVVSGRGGYAVKIGEGETGAPWRLDGVAATRVWLERLCRDGAAP
jgi:trehalose 6-phosphate phosphatase